MPTITYKGPFYERKSPDIFVPAFVRMQPREVSQEWLNLWRRKISDEQYIIEGDEGVHFDEGADGIPDESWTKAKISEWLVDNGAKVGKGYKTKTNLLGMVDKVLNPPAPASIPEAEPVVEEITETPVEAVVEETQTEIMEE